MQAHAIPDPHGNDPASVPESVHPVVSSTIDTSHQNRNGQIPSPSNFQTFWYPQKLPGGSSSPLVCTTKSADYQSGLASALPANEPTSHLPPFAQQPFLAVGPPFQLAHPASMAHSPSHISPLQLKQVAMALIQSLAGTHPIASGVPQAPPHSSLSPPLLCNLPTQANSAQANTSQQRPPPARAFPSPTLSTASTPLLSPKYGDMATSPYPLAHPPSEYFLNPLTIIPGRHRQTDTPPVRQNPPFKDAPQSPIAAASPHHTQPQMASTPGPNSSPANTITAADWPPLMPAPSYAGPGPAASPHPLQQQSNQVCQQPTPMPIAPGASLISSSQPNDSTQQALHSAWERLLLQSIQVGPIKIPASMPTPTWSNGDPCLAFSEDMEAAGSNPSNTQLWADLKGKDLH